MALHSGCSKAHSRELILFLTLRPFSHHGVRLHRRAPPVWCDPPVWCELAGVAGVAKPPINVALKPTLVLLRVLLILPEPPKVAFNRSALHGVAQKLVGVIRRVLAVLLDVSCVASNSVVVVRTGDRRERDCRSNGRYSESYNAVDVGGSTGHVFLL